MTGDLAGELRDLAAAVETVEDQLQAAEQRASELADQLATATDRIADLEIELADAEADGELVGMLADVQRGVRTLDEVYEQAGLA